MPGGPRPLPSRPSLRYLKLEAKRRLAAGEFPALHDAQAVIAREHGLPSWTRLKHLCDQSQQEGHALAQLRWIITRFSSADEPGWTAPGDPEMRQHFGDHFLSVIPVGELVAGLAGAGAALREEFVIVGQRPLEAHVQIARWDIFAAVEADPPHRITGLRQTPIAGPVTDTRVAAPPPARTFGVVPAEVTGITDEALAELGLPSLVLAGGSPDGVGPDGGSPDSPAWVVAKGWADLDRDEILHTGHRFPAHCAAGIVTATAVLRLIADGRVALDSHANDHLRTVRLADDTITVRELLSHTAGVENPARLFADTAPDLVTLYGPVIPCGGPRGVLRPSNGGYAVLGQLIADITGSPFTDAVTRLVLEPLGMSRSSFPASTADIGPGAVTGYDLTPEGSFVPVPATVCTMPPVGGLWAPAADIVRLGTGWSSLLPAALAREALTPQTALDPGGPRVGLGWMLSAGGDVAMHAGGGPGITATLHFRVRDNRAHVTLTSRLISLQPTDDQVLRSWTNPAP
jgi:CubicO group peptidase (beta-lactamase class C family)